jgi:hypothetical protein
VGCPRRRRRNAFCVAHCTRAMTSEPRDGAVSISQAHPFRVKLALPACLKSWLPRPHSQARHPSLANMVMRILLFCALCLSVPRRHTVRTIEILSNCRDTTRLLWSHRHDRLLGRLINMQGFTHKSTYCGTWATHPGHPTVWLSVGREKEKPGFARAARAVLPRVVL